MSHNERVMTLLTQYMGIHDMDISEAERNLRVRILFLRADPMTAGLARYFIGELSRGKSMEDIVNQGEAAAVKAALTYV